MGYNVKLVLLHLVMLLESIEIFAYHKELYNI
jgi:hypothetical protein